MEKIIIAIFSTLPVIYWWRFRKTPLDRDYCPYAYPAWRHTGYLTSGHIDIKPPLIQWLYKVWLFLMPKRIPLLYSLRLMPLAGHCATVALLGIYGGWQASLIAGLLYANPYMWPHMANTEWLGALFLALALVLPEPYKQLALGVMWLANLKFIPLGLAIGGIMAWKEAGNCFGLLIIAWQALPFALATLYLTATGRLSEFAADSDWCFFCGKRVSACRELFLNLQNLNSIHLACAISPNSSVAHLFQDCENNFMDFYHSLVLRWR